MDLSNKPRRLPRDFNRGPCQTTTEFREKYRHRGGGPSDGQKNPDNLKNGPRFYKDTAYGQQFKNTKGDARVKKEWNTGKDLHGRIKDSHGGKYIRMVLVDSNVFASVRAFDSSLEKISMEESKTLTEANTLESTRTILIEKLEHVPESIWIWVHLDLLRIDGLVTIFLLTMAMQ